MKFIKVRSQVKDDNMTRAFQSKHKLDAKEIQIALNPLVNNLAIHLLGEPNANLSNKNQYRFGKNGSIAVTLHGPKQGLWFDHESGRGGNLLQLIQYIKQCSFYESIKFGSDYIGVNQLKALPIEKSEPNMRENTKTYTEIVFQKSLPITGTLGEKYLREHRKISGAIGDNIRFVSGLKEPETNKYHPALVVFSEDAKGLVKGMQAIWLDNNTAKKLDVSIPKRSYGNIKGTLLPVQNGGVAIAVAEGVETALSVACARPDLTVYASLGSITNFSQSEIKGNGRPLIICADNDIKNPNTEFKTNEAAKELANKGFNVFVTKPDQNGFDFNDVLQKLGQDEVSRLIDNASMKFKSINSPRQDLINTRNISQEKTMDMEL